MPKAPDRKAAQEALERLLRPFRGYLKDNAANRAALAAAALTAVLRPSLPTAPGILIDGNNPAVGKGKLARTLSALATGGLPAIVTEGHSDEETEKRIATAVLQGAPVILLDNLQRHARQLDAGKHAHRAGGRHPHLRQARQPAGAVPGAGPADGQQRQPAAGHAAPDPVRFGSWSPTRSPSCGASTSTRCEEAMRDRASCSRPPSPWCWHGCGSGTSPENKEHRKPLGSFEEWADLVAGAVSWLTGKNPIDLIEEQKDQSPQAADERRVIDALVEWQGRLEGEKAAPVSGGTRRKRQPESMQNSGLASSSSRASGQHRSRLVIG